jgi:hypothetical protein
LTVPTGVLVTWRVYWAGPKVAVTVVAAVIGTVHDSPLPLHPPPDQLARLDPGSGAAVRVTLFPARKDAEHVLPQSIVPGLDVIFPVPVPALATVKVYCLCVNCAVTVVALSMLSEHFPVPEQGADHPVKLEYVEAVAVRSNVATAPVRGALTRQVPSELKQLTPVPVTLPAPVPENRMLRSM